MKQVLLVIGGVFLVVNVGVLYYIVLFGDMPEFARRVDLVEQRMDSLVRRDDPEVVPEVKVGGASLETENEALVILSDQQEDEIVELVEARVNKKLELLVGNEVAVEVAKQGLDQTQVKEFFVPFGSASVQTDNFTWKDTGAQADINLSNYGVVKSITFEATLRVPSGNGQVEARLYNVQSGGAVGGSELSGDGATGVLRKSGGLILPGGNKTYRVQMRTSQNFEGLMEGGRVRIITQ